MDFTGRRHEAKPWNPRSRYGDGQGARPQAGAPQEPKERTGREGKQTLADSIKDALNIFLEDKEGFGGVEGIHFTSFVLQ